MNYCLIWKEIIFIFLNLHKEVIDIREQYLLLPLEEILSIAMELGIPHHKNPKTNEPIVMITDFLITLENNGEYYEAIRNIKSKDDLLDRRTNEKFEI